MNRKRLAAALAAAVILSAALPACSALQALTSTSGAASLAVGNMANTSSLQYIAEFDSLSIMSFDIVVDEDEWQTLLDNATDKEYIPADVTINGTTITNVGIRAKGNSSLSSVATSDSDRYSFKIQFDEYVQGQTWLGLDKLVLNGNFADATSMKEYLSYDIMTYIGVSTPLFAYADITLNGESWGFYLAVEDTESSFRERNYGGEGELYKPGNDMNMGNMGGGDFDFSNLPDMQNGAMPQMPQDSAFSNGTPPGGNTTSDNDVAPEGATAPSSAVVPDGNAAPSWDDGAQGGGRGDRQGGGFMGGMSTGGVSLQYIDDDPASYPAIFDNAKTKTTEEDHARVITALKNLDEGTDLETHVDVDAVLRYFAAHTVVVNLDSYVSSMGHNYVLYENGSGQLSIVPWDYNLSFGAFQSSDASAVVNFPIDTPVSGVSLEDRPLLGRLLEVPEYLERYHEYLQEILDGYFADGQFERKVDELDALISAYVQNDPTAFYTYEEYEAAIIELKELGALRAQSVQGQLDGTIPATTQGQQADSSSLIDASGINMAAMGTQGSMLDGDRGGFGGDREGFGGGMPGGFGDIDMDAARQAMEILSGVTDGAVTDDQRAQLNALGFTDEQIAAFLQMTGGRTDMFTPPAQ